MFQRNIRLQVDISCATPPSNEGSSTPSPNFDLTGTIERSAIYCINFTLLSGKQTIVRLTLLKLITDFLALKVLFVVFVACASSSLVM